MSILGRAVGSILNRILTYVYDVVMEEDNEPLPIVR